MTRRRRTTVSRQGWIYLLATGVVFVVAMVKEVNLLLLLAGMMAGPVVFSWQALAVALRGLAVRRKVPQGVCAGDLLVVNLTLGNTRRRVGSWAVVVEEQVQRETAGPAEEPVRLEVLFPYVPAGQSRQGVYRGRLARRGRYRLGPLRLSTYFPFGIFCRTVTIEQTDTMIVYPRLGRLTRRWAARQRQSLAGASRRERRQGPEGDFYGLREWRGGDSRRWIHWRSSARTGKLMVRQFEQPRNRDVAVLVDLWQPRHPSPQAREHVELAVGFAATVVDDLCRAGSANLLLGVANPQPRCLRGPASAALLGDMLEQLAVAEGQTGDHLAEVLEEAVGEIQPGTEIVLVSTRPIDLSDRSRFGSLWRSPARRAVLRRVRSVDVSSGALSEYYQPE